MKILYLVEFVRENYFSTDKYGKPQLDFKSSEAYLELEKILLEKNIDLESVDFDYAYPRVPEPKKLDRNNNIISYEDVKISEIKEYLPELEDKIANNKYDLVIVTGKNGLKAFSKSGSSITKLRGVPEKIEVKGHETWLLPMYSIEYVWARLNNARFLSLDLDMVKEFTKQGQEYFEPVKTEYLNLTSIEQVHAVFDYIKKEKPLVAWDLETNTLQPDNKGAKVIMISLSWADKQGVTIPLYKKETPFSEEECEVILQRMGEFLADPNIWKVGHNCRFDIHFLMSAHNIKDFVNTLDTKVGYYLTISQENNVSFKLSDLAYEFTDMGGYDDELENYKKEYIKSYAKENKKDPLNEVDGTKFNYDWIPMDILAYYAAGDADCTRRICMCIMDKINQREQWKNLFYRDYPRLITTLAQIQSNGMYVDKETFKEVQEAYDKQVEILQEELRQFPAVKEMERENRELYKLGIEEFKKPVAERNKDIVKYRDKFRKAGTNFNPNSNLEKAKVLYHFTEVKLKKKDSKIFLKDSFANKKMAWEDTDYTMYKTDKFAVGELAKGDYGEDVAELAEKMLEYSSISTLRGNYINKYPNYISNVDNCIHGTFNETGTATSRLSSSNPNIQQISTTSSDVKKFDYKYPVKRIFKSRFKNGIILNADYSALEIRILGLAARDDVMTDSFFKGEDAHKNTASIVFEKPISEVTADERQASKAISFGLIYGKENYTMAQDLGISNEEADEMVNRYFSNKPAVRDFIDNTKKGLEKNGYVETLQGHRRLLNEVFGDKISYNDAMRQSVNTVIQGTGAFLTNTSIVYINEMLKNMKSKLIATVHDSVLLDVHSDEIHEVAPKVKYIMENLPIPFLQIEWEGKIVQYPITSDIEIGESYEDVFEYNKEEFSKFKTVHGFTEYKKAEKYIIDSFECGYITEEEKNKKLKELEADIESYYKL